MRNRFLTWTNAVTLLLVAMVVYRVFVLGHVRGPQDAQAPAITMRTLDGQRISLQDLRGKAVIVNFWATWCGPCRLETPWLQRVADRHGQDVVVIGILQDNAGDDEVRSFMSRQGAHYPIVRDSAEIEARMGGISVLPTTFYIGRDGAVVHAMSGLAPEFLMNAFVNDALRKGR